MFGLILFSAFISWKIDWGSSSSAGAFPTLQGFSFAFTPLVGHFRDEDVHFDSVLFVLGFFFPRIVKSPLFCTNGHSVTALWNRASRMRARLPLRLLPMWLPPSAIS